MQISIGIFVFFRKRSKLRFQPLFTFKLDENIHQIGMNMVDVMFGRHHHGHRLPDTFIRLHVPSNDHENPAKYYDNPIEIE